MYNVDKVECPSLPVIYAILSAFQYLNGYVTQPVHSSACEKYHLINFLKEH